MYLTKKEEQMLEGEDGRATQLAMELLVTLGEKIHNAEKMTTCTTCHLLDDTCWENELLEEEIKVRCMTTNNPHIGRGVPELSEEMDVPKKAKIKEEKVDRVYKSLGLTLIYSCVPYLLGNTPKFGDHISWSASSGQVYSNSILGARCNRQGGPADLAAAITGRTPEYGMHLTENRYGQILVSCDDFDFNTLSTTDISTMSYYIGEQIAEKIPVFTDIPGQLTIEQVKALTVPLPVSGATIIYHIVGVTPEARTLEEALGRDKPEDKIQVSSKDIKNTYEKLCTTSENKVDLVIFGCPHCTYNELSEVASLLEGKKVHKGVRFWICTAKSIRTVAERMGIVDTIESAGGLVISDTCAIEPWLYMPEINVVATNSAKIAYYGSAMTDAGLLMGSTRKCIDAAITGVWK
jgi:predicted aconitase